MPNVLVVDDSAIDRTRAGRLLEKEQGIQVAYAVDGRAALDEIQSRIPDLIVTDLQMPEMNGLELVERLKARLAWADSQLGERDFVLGARFSVADAHLFAILGMLRLVGLNLADWPSLAAHSIRIGSRPAVQAALKAEGLA